MNRKFFSGGETIFKEGDHGDCLYMVHRGVVEIFQDRADHRVVIGRIRKGEIFGEMALIDGEPRMASARAASDCELIQVSGVTFRDHLSKTTPFIRAVVGILVKNLRAVDRWHGQEIIEYDDDEKPESARQNTASAKVTEANSAQESEPAAADG